MACSISKLQNRLVLVARNVSWRRRKAHLQVKSQLKQYYLCCFCLKVHKDMHMFQWNHRTTMAYHSCPVYSDVWRLCNNDFIFVMSTCRFFITPGRGAGSLAIPVSGLLRAAPQRPVAKQRWGMLSPCAQNLRVYWLARQIEDCRSA